VLSRRSDEIVGKYLGVRNLNDDPYKSLVQSRSAHASEASILRLFWWLWIILFSSMLIHFGWHVANPSWRPAPSSQSSGGGTEILAGAGALFVKSSMNVSLLLAI
jgi:TRAP-type C4-dicarboxylate transport system permease small subunit